MPLVGFRSEQILTSDGGPDTPLCRALYPPQGGAFERDAAAPRGSRGNPSQPIFYVKQATAKRGATGGPRRALSSDKGNRFRHIQYNRTDCWSPQSPSVPGLSPRREPPQDHPSEPLRLLRHSNNGSPRH
ncbi:unnamed protein product [Boreogadus saida]